MAVPAARRYVVEELDRLPARPRETAELLVSELVTNAVRHGGGFDVTVSVELSPGGDRLHVGVTDSGHGDPVIGSPQVRDEHGRGLQLVGLLADRWGVRRSRGSQGKTVWFELAMATADRGGMRPGASRVGA
jgi:anti-sigma regulatory factor (Ser/Thr protein kinase)